MTNIEVIQSIRDILNGKNTKYDISEILYKHKCYYILALLNNTKFKRILEIERFSSMIAIRERYRALTYFFEKCGIKYAIIKGVPLSLAIYNDPYLRFSGDIDILIDKKNIDTTKEILCSLGFIQGKVENNNIVQFSRSEVVFQAVSTHQVAPYVKATKNIICPFINVDINTDLMWGESKSKFDIEHFLSYVETVEIEGMYVNKLLPEAEFIALCLHHYKDLNSIYLLYERGICLGHFFDIYFYIKNAHMDMLKLLDLAKSICVGEYIYYCLYFSNQIFDDNLLKKYLELFDDCKNMDLIFSFGLSKDERKRWKCDFFTRLFAKDITKLMEDSLTLQDRIKIELNKKYM